MALDQPLWNIQLVQNANRGRELLIRLSTVVTMVGQLAENLVGERRRHPFLMLCGEREGLPRLLLGGRKGSARDVQLGEAQHGVTAPLLQVELIEHCQGCSEM